jgi:hypothetical protein
MPTLPNGTTTLLPTGNYKVGTFNTQIYTLLVGQSHIVAAADRNKWPDIGSDVVSLTVNVSFDAGATTELLAAFTAGGGDIMDFSGQTVITQSDVRIDVPQPDNPNREVQAIVTTFAALNTAVYVTMS